MRRAGKLAATGRGGMVTSPSPLATAAGLAVLQLGGTAIEAAVATGAVLTVVYPHFCGLGGDAVWLIAEPEGEAVALLGIGQAAAACGTPAHIPLRGPGAALTTAAVVDSWDRALAYSAVRWGGRLSLASLLEPAIGYAADGFPVSASQAHWLQVRATEIGRWPGFSALFLNAGKTPQTGEPLFQPALAASLRAIAHQGARTFYEGELARRLADGLAAAGSPLVASDLAATHARFAPPLAMPYRGLHLLAPPPPTQGVTTLAIMGALAARGGAAPQGDADDYHLLVEAVKQAFLWRETIADPGFVPQRIESRLSRDSLEAAAGRIDPAHALDWPEPFRPADTVFFGVVDARGRAASVLQSTYFDWGSGVVAGDTGVLWHNRGAAFSTVEGHPNRLAPGKRPFHTLNPGIAMHAGRPHLIYGTQGADGQPQTLALLLGGAIDRGLPPAEALRRPRFLLGRTFSDSRDSLKVEADIGRDVIDALARRGHDVAPIEALSPLAGQAGMIRIEGDVLSGAHDPRGEGATLAVEG